jgi:hypothetical protein
VVLSDGAAGADQAIGRASVRPGLAARESIDRDVGRAPAVLEPTARAAAVLEATGAAAAVVEAAGAAATGDPTLTPVRANNCCGPAAAANNSLSRQELQRRRKGSRRLHKTVRAVVIGLEAGVRNDLRALPPAMCRFHLTIAHFATAAPSLCKRNLGAVITSVSPSRPSPFSCRARGGWRSLHRLRTFGAGTAGGDAAT